jgi:hypothetical protein
VFTGAIIYMGIHKEPQIRMYWNTDFNESLIYTIASYISFAVSSKSNDIVIFLVLRVIKKGVSLIL